MLISKQINLYTGSKWCEFLYFYSRNKSWASVHSVNHIILCGWSFQAINSCQDFSSPRKLEAPPKAVCAHGVCSWDTGGERVYQGWGGEGRARQW